MLDPLAQQVGVGGAVAIIIVATVLKFLPAFMAALKANGKNGNNKRNSSGEKDPSYWTAEIARIIEEKLKAHDLARNEAIRQLLVRELGNWGSSEDFRRILRDELKRDG